MSMTLVQSVEAEQLKGDVPAFGPGDNVRVHVKVVEGTRERIQVFEGVVIRRRAGGANENFTVRRSASHGIGVERTFLIHSPRIDRIEVVRTGRVRRARLYFLRGRTGRAARIRERRRPAGSLSLRGAGAAKSAPVVAPVEDVATLATDESQSDVEEQVLDAETTAVEADITEAAEVSEDADATVGDGAESEKAS